MFFPVTVDDLQQDDPFYLPLVFCAVSFFLGTACLFRDVGDCVKQIVEGNRSIAGLMLESNLNWGNQPIPEDLSKLRYGVSVTDACIDWDTTEEIISAAHDALRPVLC